MTRIEFDQMVERLEHRFHGRAAALTRTAVLWALLGYAVLILGFACSLALAAFCMWAIYQAPSALTIKLGLVFGLSALLIAWSIFRGAWIRLSPPQGRVLDRREAPRLFEMIDSTSAEAGGIPFHRVLLTEDLNACVVQIPRLGVFGWYRSYLCLGIQLMDALSPEEFQAVLAHEFAHLSRAHGRTGNWLYRIRRSWENVATALSGQGGWLVRPFAAFFGWFWPRFNARAFVLSRANEYEADAFAAAVTSPATTASALSRIAVENQRIDEEFWEKLGKRTADESEAPGTVFEELAALLRTRIDPTCGTRWLSQQLARTTDTSDTHPSLKDRIAALRTEAAAAPMEPVTESAADFLLGSGFAREARAAFSRMWLEVHGSRWRDSHEQNRSLREQLAELETAEATPDSLWEKLRLKCNLHGVPAVAGEIAGFVRAHPDHQLARFVLGSHLLSIDDGTGVALLEQVASAAPHSAFDCFEQLAAYHDRHGNAEAIRDLKRRADEHESIMGRAVRERFNASPNDRFDPSDLSELELAAARKAIAAVPEVREAWLVRRHPREMPEWKSYVLIVKLKFPAFRLVSEKRKLQPLQQLADSIEVGGHLVVFNDESNHKRIARKIRAIPGSQVFSRNK